MIAVAAISYWKARPEALAHGTPSSASNADGAPRLRDARTTAAVHTALTLRRTLRPYPIDADTRAGVVTLRGEVAHEEDKVLAGRIAVAVPDVRGLSNQIRVNRSLAPPTAEGRSAGENVDDRALEIQVNLAYSLNRNLKGTQLEVHADRRGLTIGGLVDGPEQRALAVELAREIAGVAQVSDQIQLRRRPAPAVPARP